MSENVLEGPNRVKSVPYKGIGGQKPKDPESPATTSMAYDTMLPRFEKIEAVLGGTEAMREAGEKFLPRHEEESVSAYNERKACSVLLGLTELTLDNWVGRPFSKPIKYSENMPEQIKDLLDDIDMMGNELAVFCREWFRCGLSKGLSHVLVEQPRPAPKDGPRSLADDEKENIRPYWVLIRPENLFFAYATLENGKEVLQQIRVFEEYTELNGFAEVTRKRIRVYYPDRVELYELQKEKEGQKKEEWKLIDTIEDYGIGQISLVTFYTSREGLMMSKPPILDLADLNIAHWQSGSDQRSILTVSRFPMLALSGGDEDESKLTIGPKNWLFTPEPQGKFYYVEHTGKAISAGRTDLRDLEEQMASYGAEFLKKRPGSPTATARALDSAEATSPLQDITMRFVDAVNQALYLTALWLGLEDSGTVEMATDFGLSAAETANLITLNEARKNGDISRTAYIEELKRYNVVSPKYDPVKDLEELEKEALLPGLAAGGTDDDLDPGADPNDGSMGPNVGR